jgi:hypothetical protein
VSLLFVGLVNLGILGALNGLIEGPRGDPTNALDPEMAEQLLAAMRGLERSLAKRS